SDFKRTNLAARLPQGSTIGAGLCCTEFFTRIPSDLKVAVEGLQPPPTGPPAPLHSGGPRRKTSLPPPSVPFCPHFSAPPPRRAPPVGLSQAKRKPDRLIGVKYGPHERNVLDLWKAPSSEPTPLVVFIHGGGFHAGSKELLRDAFRDACLDAGISVMSINYRL